MRRRSTARPMRLRIRRDRRGIDAAREMRERARRVVVPDVRLQHVFARIARWCSAALGDWRRRRNTVRREPARVLTQVDATLIQSIRIEQRIGIQHIVGLDFHELLPRHFPSSSAAANAAPLVGE